MGSLKQGEHHHPDGSFHSWSGVQFTGRKADVDVETGKIAPSSKGFEHQNVDTWAHPDAGREMNKRAQEEAYKRSLGLEMGGGTGYDASGLPNRRRTIEKYAPDAEFGLFSGSEQAPLPNAGAIASMGANGTGQSVYDEGMFDQPAEAYGTVHPNQPNMVPAMQETPVETQQMGGYFDSTRGGKFTSGVELDAGKAAAFAARESTGGAGAEITHKQYDDTRQGEFSPERLQKIESGAHDPTYDYGGASGRGHRGGGQYDTLTGDWIPTTRSTDTASDTQLGGGEEEFQQGPIGTIAPSTAAQTSKNEQYESSVSQAPNIMDMRRDEQQAQGMQEVEGGIHQQTVDPSRGLNAPPDEDFYGRSAFREEYEDLDAGAGFQGGDPRGGDPRYNKYGLDRKLPTPPIVTELMEKDADLAGVQGQDLQGEAGEYDTDLGRDADNQRVVSNDIEGYEKFDYNNDGKLNDGEWKAAQNAMAAAERQQDTRDKEQYLEETDPEGYYDPDGYWRDDKTSKYMDYDADFWRLNPTFRGHNINEEQWGEISKKLDWFSSDSQLFDDIKSDRETWLGNDADFKMQEKHRKSMVKNMHDFMRGTSEYGAKGYGSSKYFGDDVNAEAEMLWQALKGSGVSIEEFNTMYDDATKFHGISDDRKKRIQEFTYEEGQHMAHSKLGNIFGAEGEAEETPKLREGMFDEGGEKMEDQLTEGFTDDSEMGGYGEKKQGQEVQLGDGSTAKVNPTSGGDIGTTVDADSPEQAVAMSGAYNANIREAMRGDLGTDVGRAALLEAIDGAIPIPHGYTWNQANGELTWDTMAGFSADMAGGTTTTGEPVNPYDDSKTIAEKTAGMPADTVRMEKESEAQLSQALRMRDMAAGFYEEATGESIGLQADLAEQSAMGISREGMASLDNVSAMATMYTTKMSTALKNNNLDAIEAGLSTPLPAPPPGMVWDKASGRFMQRPGQAGRQMDVETQKWQSMAETVYSMRDRAASISEMGRKLEMETNRREAEKLDLDEKFREHMLSADIDSAEEVLMKQKIAETEEIANKGKRENLQMVMQLIQNPIALGMAKRHGLLGQIESQLGFTGISDTVPDVPAGAGTPNINEWSTMTSVEKAMRVADLSEQGGDVDEFMRMIKGTAPGQMQRVQYGVVGQGGTFG